MSDWSMTVEAGASPGGLSSSGAGSSGSADSAAPAGMVATVLRAGRAEPEPLGPVAVEGPATPDSLADALAALAALGGGEGEPARLAIVTDPDADGRIFDELDEAAALAGLPAPTWLPAPVALAGAPLAERLEPGDRAVVLDTRGGDLTAWPVERTSSGLAVGEAGPVAVAERLDELITGVVRATGAAREGTDPDSATGPIDTGVDTAPVTVGEGAIRRESARLRREVRRVRRSLAEDEVEEVTVSSGSVGGVVDRALFTQLVTVALSESMITLFGDAGVAVEVVAAGPTPLARSLAELTGAVAETVHGPHAAVLGAAALLGPVPSGRSATAVTDDSPTDDLPRGALAAAVAGAGAATLPASTADAASAPGGPSSSAAEAAPAATTGPASAPEPAPAPQGGSVTADDAPTTAPTVEPVATEAVPAAPTAPSRPAGTATAGTSASGTSAGATSTGATSTGATSSDPSDTAPPSTSAAPAEPTAPAAPAEPASPTASTPSSEPTATPTAVATSTDGTTSTAPSTSTASPTSATATASPTSPTGAGEPDPRRSSRPRWAVPALAVSLVVAIVGALGVILLGPDSTGARTGTAPAPLVVELAGPTTGLPAGVVGPPALSR